MLEAFCHHTTKHCRQIQEPHLRSLTQIQDQCLKTEQYFILRRCHDQVTKVFRLHSTIQSVGTGRADQGLAPFEGCKKDIKTATNKPHIIITAQYKKNIRSLSDEVSIH